MLQCIRKKPSSNLQQEGGGGVERIGALYIIWLSASMSSKPAHLKVLSNIF